MPVVNTLQDACISHDPNHRIGSSLWAICACEASGLAKIVMPGFLREKDQLIGESDLVWSYILRAWRTPLEVVNSRIVNCGDAY